MPLPPSAWYAVKPSSGTAPAAATCNVLGADDSESSDVVYAVLGK